MYTILSISLQIIKYKMKNLYVEKVDNALTKWSHFSLTVVQLGKGRGRRRGGEEVGRKGVQLLRNKLPAKAKEASGRRGLASLPPASIQGQHSVSSGGGGGQVLAPVYLSCS